MFWQTCATALVKKRIEKVMGELPSGVRSSERVSEGWSLFLNGKAVLIKVFVALAEMQFEQVLQT